MATPWAWHLSTTRLHPQNSTFPHLGRPIFEQRALSPMSVFPADFPSFAFLETNSFRVRMLKKHIAFPNSACFPWEQSDIGKKLKQWQWQGLRPLAVALIGVDQLPPLWTRPTGSDFVRGSKLVAKPYVAEQRKITRTQVLLLQSLWTPVELPHHSNNHTPGPKPAKPRMSSVDNTPACNSPLTRFAIC